MIRSKYLQHYFSPSYLLSNVWLHQNIWWISYLILRWEICSSNSLKGEYFFYKKFSAVLLFIEHHTFHDSHSRKYVTSFLADRFGLKGDEISLSVSKFSFIVFKITVTDREQCQFAWSVVRHSRTALKFEALFSTTEMFRIFPWRGNISQLERISKKTVFRYAF